MTDTNVTRELLAGSAHWDLLEAPLAAPVADALALLPVYVTRYVVPDADPSDVASIARMILPSLLAAGYDASTSAGAAVRRAVRAMLRDRGATDSKGTALGPVDILGDDIRTADADEPSGELWKARTPRYVGADTTWGDTLLTALALARPYLTDSQAAIIRELGQVNGWHVGALPVQRIARNLGAPVSGRAAMRFGAEVREAVQLVSDTVANVLRHDTAGHRTARPDALAFFTRRLGTRPALARPVSVRAGTATPRTAGTSDHGYVWKVGHSTREATRADVLASTASNVRTASRPAGVGAGMRHGAAGAIAGAGTPTPRPVPSAKRKGGTGQTGPTVPLSVR